MRVRSLARQIAGREVKFCLSKGSEGEEGRGGAGRGTRGRNMYMEGGKTLGGVKV